MVLQDEEYVTAGAKIGTVADAFGQDIVLKIRPPGEGRWLWASGLVPLAGSHLISRILYPLRLLSAIHVRSPPWRCLPADMELEVPLLKRGARLVCFVFPAQNPQLVEALAQKEMTVIGARGHSSAGEQLPWSSEWVLLQSWL